MKNNTFEEIAGVLSASEKVLIFPHVNMDGDALGSGGAVRRGLRKIGKECYVLIEDDIPFNLNFWTKDTARKTKISSHMPMYPSAWTAATPAALKSERKKFAQAPVSVCMRPPCHYGIFLRG